MNKQKITIISLVLTVAILTQYIMYENWNEKKQVELDQAYKNGYNNGLGDAVNSLYQNTEDCHTASIVIGNLTRYVSDIRCSYNNSSNHQ